ncbi:MAG: septum formation family protein, partial [Acidimicrobiia bacterium]|nr:septum formation family protein [Acidimicrobiia bacterium]
YQPDEDEWAAGDRYAACVVARADPSYAIYELVGPAAASETPVVTFGMDECFGLNRRAGQLRCDQPHIFQMVGTVSYPGDAEASLPSVSDRRQMLGDECDSLASDVVGEPKSSNHRVLGTYDPISRVEWEAGLREVPCFAYLVDDALAPLTIVGRLDGEHTVLGNTDDSIAA